MSNTIGDINDLNASRTEALQGLLRSLGYTRASDDPSDTPSVEQLQKLSGKIKEILGDGGDPGLTLGDQPTQVLNEDGLPIVDISEHVNEDFQTSTTSPPAGEQDLISLPLLPPDERERRRRERDQILDLLEEEERLQQLQEERDAEGERKEAIRRRKESARAELERLKAARKLQKKMGRALVRHTKEAGEIEDARSMSPKTTPLAAKKKVSFADVPSIEADESDQQTSVHQPGWGNVTLGRLRAQTRVPLVSSAEAQKYPMKMRVVERHPTESPTFLPHNDADSDDESTSSAGPSFQRLQDDSSSEEDRSSGSSVLIEDEMEGGFDYNIAQHHREIALEYHEKRQAVCAETARAMNAYTLDEHDQPETPNNRQLPLSRFRADRMAAAYHKSHGPLSTSIGQTVIPPSRQKSLQNSVRLGKLENDQLVGGESGESGSDDEKIREAIQMLRTGTIQNVGPDFEPHPVPTINPLRTSDAVVSSSLGMSTVARGAKPSRFKVARGGGTTTLHGGVSRDAVQPQPAISSVVERNVPKSR